MRAAFDDFCLWVDVVVDERWRCLPAGYTPASGPPPACSESEMIALALIGECCGWAMETDLVRGWRGDPHLFPVVPERSRFNRRRRNRRHALNAIRRGTLAALDLAADRQCAIDSVPVPVVAVHLVPSAAGVGDWRAAGADFGKVPTRQQTIFGDKLHVLVTLGGVIRDFALAPASASRAATHLRHPRSPNWPSVPQVDRLDRTHLAFRHITPACRPARPPGEV